MGYSDLRNEMVSAANGIDYAYRDTGGSEATVPLVLLQHFRGNLDSWDPALIDALAQARRVVTFDNAGVGGSTGTTPDTIEQMARDAIAFIAAMGISQADILGFSIGSFVAQQIALVRSAIVRRLILASSAPQGAAGLHGWAPEVRNQHQVRQQGGEQRAVRIDGIPLERDMHAITGFRQVRQADVGQPGLASGRASEFRLGGDALAVGLLTGPLQHPVPD